jgi:pimeloyl-ACP methyl ester carboxylesterase
MEDGPLYVTRLEVPVDGGSLAAFRLTEADAGDGTAPVVAVHGITSHSRTWVAVARELGDAVTLITVDLRGRGASNALPEPYGLAAHARDTLAVLDRLELERAVLVGHSLGAYVVARVAAEHPERVSAALMVDGGLRIPGTESVDPQAFLDAFLGPAVARLRMRFESRQAYRDWWRAHPALAGSDVDDRDLNAYADYDLLGEEPQLRSAVSEAAVRGDAADLLERGDDAAGLTMPAMLLVAPRGLQNDPRPMQPLPLAREWEAGAPDRRETTEVPGVNHYTIVLGGRGARAVAGAVRAALTA